MNDALLVALLAGASVVMIGAAILRLRIARRESDTVRRRILEEHEVPVGLEGRSRLITTARRAGELVTPQGASLSLRQKLAAAGYHGASSAEVFLGAKLLLLIVGGGAVAALLLRADMPMGTTLLLAAFGGAVLFFVPDLVVGIARDRRREEIRRNLPGAIDLLEICVSAGLGLDQAWTSVAEEIRRVSPTLADEMELTNLEISLGTSRAVAMRHMAERTGAADISSLVALLVQSERFGASIVDALRTFATTMRETWSQRAEEAAERMAVKMLFPMVMFIFPALLIVLVGPALLGLIEVLGS